VGRSNGDAVEYGVYGDPGELFAFVEGDSEFLEGAQEFRIHFVHAGKQLLLFRG